MSRTEANRTLLLEGPIGPTLAKLTVPMIFGILSMVVYNLTDAFFVGKLGREHLAALSFTFPVVLMIGSLAQGIGMGTAAVVSRALGAGDDRRARRLSTDSLVLGLLIIAVGVVAGLLTIEPLFTLLGARDAVLDHIVGYMRIWYIGIIFVVVPMIGNSVLRATGDTKTPGLIMVLGAAANLVFDPLLIFGFGPIPALGIRGAAWATLIGRGITFVISMSVLVRRERLLTVEIPRPREVWESWREILHVGLPDAGARMIIPLGQGVITRVVASYGPAAVAGFGVATRVEFFSLAAIIALSAVIGPFVGQNIGAGKPDRVRAGFAVSRRFSLIVGLGAFFGFLFLAGHVASLFNEDPAVVSTAALYIRMVSLTYAAQGFFFVVNAGLNVLRRPLHAAGLSLLEMFGLAVPLVLLGSRLFGIPGIFGAIGISYFVTGAAAWWVIERVLDKHGA
ncbi:MAG: MATE family efflux transporter [Acidobacteriota bacterium]|nr:MATE family efflux transporter [Acidobacteriota bacterium]